MCVYCCGLFTWKRGFASLHVSRSRSDGSVRRRSSSSREVAVSLGQVPRWGHVRPAAGRNVGAAPAGGTLFPTFDVHVVERNVLAGLTREADQIACAAGVDKSQIPKDDVSDLGADTLWSRGTPRVCSAGLVAGLEVDGATWHPCVVQDAEQRHQLEDSDSSWCPRFRLTSRTTHRHPGSSSSRTRRCECSRRSRSGS